MDLDFRAQTNTTLLISHKGMNIQYTKVSAKRAVIT